MILLNRCCSRALVARHWFATEALAAAYVEKQKRSFGMHPSTGKEWGPWDWWIEGPNEDRGCRKPASQP
jgi:hypothetical protein